MNARRRGRGSAFDEMACYALSVLLLVGAVGAMFLDVGTEICVPVGAAGIAIMLAVETRVWWRRGLSPDSAETVCGCLALLCGVPIYYFPDETVVLLTGLGGFFVLIILCFVAQIWGKVRETRALLAQWRARTRACSEAMCAELRRYRGVQMNRMLWL